jgi:DNA-binding XRE family transcriptional regulator
MEQKELVDLIVGYRARNELTIKEMAERCGVSWLTLWNIENGKHPPRRVTERKILNIIEQEVL